MLHGQWNGQCSLVIQFCDIIYNELENVRITMNLDFDYFICAVFELCLKIFHMAEDGSASDHKSFDDSHSRVNHLDFYKDVVLFFELFLSQFLCVLLRMVFGNNIHWFQI